MINENRKQSILKGYNMLLYFAGSMITYEPSEECIVDFWRNGNLKNLPVSSSNPTFIKAASQLRQSFEDGQLLGTILKEDFRRLFGSEGLPLAPAFESRYNRQVNIPGHSCGSVTEFYNSYGWVSKLRGKIEDDHLGVEILFLTCLIDKYIVLDDSVCCLEMGKEIMRFIDNHILSWVGDWNRKIQANSNTLAFKGIGTLIHGCSEDLHSLFSNEVRECLNDCDFRN